MKILGKLVWELFESGKAIGLKTNITNATGWLKAHSKGVGEEIGNALSGKAKKVNGLLIKGDLYDKLFAHIDDVAKQYPDATVQIAAKNAKKGGYKVAKICVKNGDETVYNQALSIANDGTVKMKSSYSGGQISEFIDQQKVQAIGTSQVGTVRASYDLAKQAGQMEMNHGGKQVAVANYVNKGGNAIRGGATYEVADDLVSGQMYYNGHEISLLGDVDGLKQWGKRYQAEVQRQKDEMAPLVNQLLRPLRERFNIAIDLFKYNGKTNFERFVSKKELVESVKDLQKEAVDLEALKKVGKFTVKDSQYLAQIKTDIASAKELIEIQI